MGEKQRKLLVLYASQTGNALDAAERIGREAERRGCPASILSTDQFHPSSLPHEEAIVFVVSTTGQGDSPDSFKEFWRFLLQRNLGNSWLQRLRFAVFGLGDSGYQKYNFVAKKLDKRLLDLGATTIIEKGLGDDQHPSGYEATLDPWMMSLWGALYQINPKYFPKGPDVVIPQDELIDQPKYRILYHKQETLEPALMVESDIIERVREMSPGKLSKDKSKPDCFLKMTKNEVLTKAGSTKDVRHFEFQFVSSSIKYEVGDVVELLPSQDSSAIDAFIERCDLDPESFITVHPRETESNGSFGEVITHVPIKLKTFVELTMDVTSASPRRYFFEVMSFYATAEHEKERLQYFATPEGRDDLYNYNQKERRSVLEVLEDFPSVQMPFEWLVQLVPSLKPRAFSISSSPLAHPAQVHLTVSVVSWITPYKRPRKGLCSTWLASLTPEQGINIPVWFHKGSLPAPPQSVPLILVGPGTGCAPFRGFIAERAVQAETSPTAPVMFFFGCRNEDTDFLYRDFWESHAREGGMLSVVKGGGFYTAFSRDQPKKVYVQHKIREMRKEVWDLLCDGAAVYVAGSSTKMPCDVMSALEEIVMEETGGSKEMASRWLKALEKTGRYNVEAWS
ncbi:NADPH-dependent diflavin oxidoreductase 1 [Raphanus sativus]|uniref:NADPH-dependent diflavin oxidoreductase 1 n=1 Tax=Raphanus sativus TaxID=3726 RepID=A0A6J0NMA8_RAPSA|nr:NADPH-dependent diflavin oxidoreductase 1 [Raphanus sativus]KAJ4894294.1 NADPH-dependent diflavin oxidoreductase 1 [Raphanus sativus]